MIELLVQGKKRFFNLKDKEKEKKLFYAWYAMSDMPKYQDKNLKITTDKEEQLLYAIGEIESCRYIDEKYVEEENSIGVSSTEATSIEDLTIGQIFDKYFQYKSDITKSIKEILCKTLEGVPKIKINSIFYFCTRIREKGYILDNNDPAVNKILIDIINSPEDEDIEKFVEQYINHMKNRKLC